MFLLYHSDQCNTSGTVFHWCYVNDLHTTHAVICWVTTFTLLAFSMVIVANASLTTIGPKRKCVGDIFALIPKCILYVIGPLGTKIKPS
jgi:hypothetical protein